MTPASGPWEREVRRFVLSGLVFVLFLAIASLAALRMTTRWAVTQMESRLAAEARAVATGVEASGDLVAGLTTDAGVVRLVKEFAPLQVALFDEKGTLRRSVTWLPDAARVPDRLPPEEAPRGPQARVTRGSEGGAPVVVVAVPLVASRVVLRTVYDATPLVAAERMLRILTVVVPAGVALLVALAVPFFRRFTRPIDALAETARNADALVPSGPQAGAEPIAAVAAFARTIEERTAVKRLERELSFRRELAALGEMSAGIAHEFRNATAAILGYARLAGAAGDAEARARHLARIRSEAEHVARVTGDFLLFARPERLHLAPVALAPLVEEVLAEGRATCPGAAFSAEGAFPEFEADAALLRRALVNLVRNAAEAAGDGGRVAVRGEPTGDGGLALVVEDSGPGVSPEAAKKLFVPFTSTKEGGTGLGLSLVAKIAALHGGSVAASRSAALGGAAFRLDLPPASSRP